VNFELPRGNFSVPSEQMFKIYYRFDKLHTQREIINPEPKISYIKEVRLMPWKTGDEHKGKDSRFNKHVDVYHTDDRGKRDRPHKDDIKISSDSEKPKVRDVTPPKK
jgi:hypothetical protein